MTKQVPVLFDKETGLSDEGRELVLEHLPFVEAIACRLAAAMTHSVDLCDLVQDGVVGLIDASQRFDEGRGIKFKTFICRRVRGAMLDRLRREAWPRGVRRQRRKLREARDALRIELGSEPSLSDLAARVGFDEKRLRRRIVQINTIESLSLFAKVDSVNKANLPAELVPSEPESPDLAYEKVETCDRIRQAIKLLPPRDQNLLLLYYWQELSLKTVGSLIGNVSESRVFQLHVRALTRLREALARLKKVNGHMVKVRPVRGIALGVSVSRKAQQVPKHQRISRADKKP